MTLRDISLKFFCAWRIWRFREQEPDHNLLLYFRLRERTQREARFGKSEKIAPGLEIKPTN